MDAGLYDVGTRVTTHLLTISEMPHYPLSFSNKHTRTR